MVQNAKSSKKSVSESTEALIARIPEAELRSFLNKLCQDDLDYIEKLKSACDEPEWEGQREQILSARTCYGIRYALLASEGRTAYPRRRAMLDELSRAGF